MEYVEFHAAALDRLAKAMCAVVVDTHYGFDAGFEADRDLLCAWVRFAEAPEGAEAVHTVTPAFAKRFRRQVVTAVNERITAGALKDATARRVMRLFSELPQHVASEELILEPVYNRFRIALATTV